MASDTTSNGSSGGDQVSQGAERIRDTAKWLVAGFGALGSALIASLQLSNLGKVTGDGRDWALLGFGLGIGGVLVAMLAAASILVAVRVSLADIEEKGYLKVYIRKNIELLNGYTSFRELRKAYNGYARTRVQSYSGMLARVYKPQGDPDRNGLGSAAYRAEEALYNLSEGELGLVNPAVDLILSAAVFEKLRYRWVRFALPAIVVGVALAATGAGIFASNYQPVDDSSASSASSEALIRLTAAGQQHLGSKLGAQCSATDMQVLVLKEYSSGWLFETIDDTCNSLIFNASNDDVTVEAELQPCPLPTSVQGTVKQSSFSSGGSMPIKVC